MRKQSRQGRKLQLATSIDARLATYVAAAGGVGASVTSEAQAVIIGNKIPKPFGINGAVNVDFNRDGQTDYQIDHDRVLLNDAPIDYLQIDKNDFNGESNPTAFDSSISTFPLNGTQANGDHGVLCFTNTSGGAGGYAAGLRAGYTIGADASGSLLPGTVWDFQETGNFKLSGTGIRANRLIDEDAGVIDTTLVPGRVMTVPFGPQPEYPDLDDFIGLSGETRYLGVRIDLNDAGKLGLNDPSKDPNFLQEFWYGWIGVRIDNEADATGVVTGWAYESVAGTSIAAGDFGPPLAGDFDGDRRIGGGDFLFWQQQYGSTVPMGTGADGNGDTHVDVLDYNIWKGVFGSTTPAGTAVPEPGSILLAFLGGAIICGCWLLNRIRRRAAS